MADLSISLPIELLHLSESVQAQRRPGPIYRASVYSTTAQATYTTSPTTTPAPNSLLIAFVVSCYASSPTEPTGVTGHGVTYTKVTLPANALSTTHLISLWIADAGSSPTSAAVVVSQAGTTTGGAAIEYEINDLDLSLGILGAIDGLAVATGTGTTGTVNVPLTPHVKDLNVQMSFWVHLANEATTPRANWIEPTNSDGNFNSPATGVEAQFRTAGFELTATATWSTSSSWIGLHVEFDALTSFQPVEPLKISDSVQAQRYGDRNATPENFELDDIGQGAVDLVGPGSWLHLSDGPVSAAIVAGGDLQRTVSNEQLKISDALTVIRDPLEASANENLKISDSIQVLREPLEANKTESLKISETLILQLGDLSVAAPNQSIKISESLTARRYGDAVLSESLKIDDIGEGRIDFYGVIHVVDQLTAVMDTGDLSRAVTSENLKISDSVTAQEDPIQASPSESLKISESLTAQLDTLLVSLTENLKVSDTVSRQLDPIIVAVSTENVKISESLTAQLDTVLVSLTENVKVSDSGSQQLDPLIVSVTTENLKISDSLTASVGDLTVSVSEGLKIDDASDNWAQLYEPETIKISDSVTAVVGGDLAVAVTQEALKISESIQASEDPLQASATENLKISESVQAQLGIGASATENLKISDSMTVAIDLIASPSESLKISDSVQAVRYPLEVVSTENIKVSESVIASSSDDLFVTTIQESLKVADIANVVEDALETSRSEGLKVSDSVTAVLPTLVVSSTENVKVSDAISSQLTVLQVILSESIRLTDTLIASTEVLPDAGPGQTWTTPRRRTEWTASIRRTTWGK